MSRAKITLYGMENWCNGHGTSLFSKMELPSGLERDLVVNAIMQSGNEFEVLYANPDYMAVQVGLWSRRHYRTFDKWVKALAIEYEPLWNYDRFEKWTDDGTGTRTSTGSNGNTRTITGGYTNKGDSTNVETRDLTQTDESNVKETQNLTRTDDLSTDVSGSSTTENKRSAMDSTAYQPYTQESVSSRSETDNTGTVKNTGDVTTVGSDTLKNGGTVKNEGNNQLVNTHNDTIQDSGSNEGTENDTTKSVHDGHLYGNIGVTTSQQMLGQELEIARFNIYNEIADLFIMEFTIPVFD